MANANETQIIRFGLFEVDLRAGELRKNGVKIRLQQQPFQILAILLQHPFLVNHPEVSQRSQIVVACVSMQWRRKNAKHGHECPRILDVIQLSITTGAAPRVEGCWTFDWRNR
jgi:hypothetical protein